MSERVGHKSRPERATKKKAHGGRPLGPAALRVIAHNDIGEDYVQDFEDGVPTNKTIGLVTANKSDGRFTVKVGMANIDATILGALRMRGKAFRNPMAPAVRVGSYVVLEENLILAVLSPSQADRARKALRLNSAHASSNKGYSFNRSSSARKTTNARGPTNRRKTTKRPSSNHSKGWFSFF